LKSKNLALLLPLLLLAGCYNADPKPVVQQQPKPPARAQGVDLATDAGHVAHHIKSNGLDFVARYYRKPDSRWPTLSANEAKVLSALGLNVVAVWESHSQHRDYFTYGRGYWDAVSAYRQAKAVGQPGGSAIYFAVDFDATGADLYPIDQYFRGITAGLAASNGGASEYKVGVYGSGAVCDSVNEPGWRNTPGCRTRPHGPDAASRAGTSGRAGPSRISASITIRTRRATITAGSASPECELACRAVLLLPRGPAMTQRRRRDGLRPQQFLRPHPARRAALPEGL